MIVRSNTARFFLILFLGFGLNYSFIAQTTDSLPKQKKVKEPKHFFNTTITYDYYAKPNVDLKVPKSNFPHPETVGEHLKSYGITQGNFSFYTPLATINKYNKDSSVNSNFHLLFTGNFLALVPHFDGIADHTLTKFGVGLRAIYNTGKKSIFFIETSPFLTQDASYPSDAIFRIAGTLLWSYSPNEHFNFRLGATKSFMWGNRYYLPFVGFRFGRLDKVNFSIQFPRIASLNIPMGQRVRFSLFTKPQGGLFNFSNRDTIYNISDPKENKTIHFGRYEVLTGIRFDVVPTKWLSFYVASGFSTGNYMAFYSNTYNKGNDLNYWDFYSSSPANTWFFNFGLSLRFGKTKSYINNKNIYEAIDINNTVDPGENNVNPGNANIPIQKKKVNKELTKLKPSEVQDLVDLNDF